MTADICSDYDDDDSDEISLPHGSMNSLFVVEEYHMQAPFDLSKLDLDSSQTERLGLQPDNITLPIALMLKDEEAFPTLSKARKACRKGTILLKRSGDEQKNVTGKVGDRVYPGDTIGRQVRLSTGEATMYTAHLRHPPPPFELPVIYEDDSMAIVNKPAGVVVYRQGGGLFTSTGLLSVRAALPFVLTPPRRRKTTPSTDHVLRRPASVHRLDKPTSGLLVVAKTKAALTKLSAQFHDRNVQKMYHAIVLGVPSDGRNSSLSNTQVRQQYGVDTGCSDTNAQWHVIDHDLDDRTAITIWRAVRSVKSLVISEDNRLTLVEMHPKTGRFHQLRRHMAFVCDTPIVGDTKYDGGGPVAMKFRQNGLFLCSTRVTLDYLYDPSDCATDGDSSSTPACSTDWSTHQDTFASVFRCPETNKVKLTAFVPLPRKFSSLMQREESRHDRLHEEAA